MQAEKYITVFKMAPNQSRSATLASKERKKEFSMGGKPRWRFNKLYYIIQNLNELDFDRDKPRMLKELKQ